MERFKEVSLIAIIGLIAAFGPGLVDNNFYFSRWESDWVQAVSASVAVIVALILPVYRDYKNDQKLEASRREVETIAIFATYHEALRLTNFFSTVSLMLDNNDYGELGKYLEREQSITGEGYGRFDVSSSLGSKYAEHYYIALTNKMQVTSTVLSMINMMSVADQYGQVKYDGDDPFDFRTTAEGLIEKGGRFSKILMDETENRSRHMQG